MRRQVPPPVSMVLQLQLVTGSGPQNRRSAPPYWPSGLGRILPLLPKGTHHLSGLGWGNPEYERLLFALVIEILFCLLSDIMDITIESFFLLCTLGETLVCFSSVRRAPSSATEPSVQLYLNSGTICRRTSYSRTRHIAISHSRSRHFHLVSSTKAQC